MAECEKLSSCAFVKAFENDDERKLALKGFVRMYCQGDKQEICTRKKVSQILNGPHNVPSNMMPNGFPLFGTSNEHWSSDVHSAINK
ncbi:MAG: hypothetical protein EHM12_01675 [Dehalococcoidia bacterium]|nr:MAG: hypothetical protein EHM12_01675 [Dehalococcoidia bacterium]